MKLTNDKDLKGKHVEATVRLWLWHVEGMINLSRMLVNVLYFISGLEVLNYKLPTLQNKDELQNSSLAASSIKVLTSGPANISHDMKGLLDMSEGSPVPTILGYSNLDSLVSLGITSKDLYTQTKLEIANRVPVIQSLVTGAAHTMMLTKNFKGKVKIYASGLNKYGQLGLGDFDNRNDLTEVILPDGFMIEEFLAGGFHTFIKGKGKNGEDKLYASGNNKFGQLALSDNQDRVQWTKVIIPSEFKLEKVIAGGFHTFLKGKDKGGEDKLYASGYNRYGQLGLGDNNDRNEWTEVDLPENFKLEQFVGGGLHSFLKGTVGGEDKLYAFGYNDYGQLGLGNDERGSHQWAEVDIPRGFRLEQVAAGGAHSFLKGTVDGEAKLYACGNNASCQLGLGDSRKRNKLTAVDIPQGFSLEKVIAGSNNTFLKGKGVNGEDKLYACGSNHCGQLGLGYTPSRHELTEVTFSDGFKIEQVRAGNIFTFVKGTVGGEDMIYATGDNDYGQLGLGDRWGRAEWTEVPIRNMVLKSIVSQEEASMNKKRSGGK